MSAPSTPAIHVRNHPTPTASPSTHHRALHATRALRAGQTIHIFTSPLLLHPTRAHLPAVCTHCLRPGGSATARIPRACSGCRAAFYCDDACQRAAWTAVHARECKALRSRRDRPGAAAADLPTPVRVLLQALLKTEVEARLAGLEGHVDARRRRGGKQWADVEMMAAAACAFASAGKDGRGGARDVSRAIEMLCKIQTNAFHRFDADLADEAGIFLDPTLAMANHSCIPNATVLFVGRTAVLRAERPIREGEEIKICYTDYTNPISVRKSALQEYHFTCQCPRCADNLNVYQVCAQFFNDDNDSSSNTTCPRTSCSVVGSKTPQLQHHPGASDPRKIQIAAQFCTAFDLDITGSSPEARRLLKMHLRACTALMDNDLWAVSPLPQMLTEVSLCYAHEENYTRAVVVAAMVAVECDPYRYAAPFHVVRLKNLLMMVKLLKWTAEETAVPGSTVTFRAGTADPLEGEIRQTLAEMDQVSLSQMLLMMVFKAASLPGGGLDQWSLGLQARELYDDIAALDGRDKELSLIHAWRDDPESEASRMFFDYAVVKQMAALASLGKRVMRLEWHV